MPQVSQPIVTGQGVFNALNLTVPTVVKALPGRITRISVLVAGTAAGAVYDTATIGGAVAARQILAVPTTSNLILADFVCTQGIVVSPGAGQTLAVSFA